jgi:CheY-like chemotaxis protein
MTPDVRARIFEPFYTTKPRGQGTGLGLSTVHGIVKQSDGHIEVYSERGQGTTFKVYLPRTAGVVEAPRPSRPVATVTGGNETILLVEDEEAIRRVVRESLTARGYRVLDVEDGSAAIAVCEGQEPIDLLLTDVVMPLMSGPELAHRVAPIRPQMPVLFMSGYTDRALIHHGHRPAGSAFLHKPFTPDALALKVRELLDASRQRAA